MRIIYDIVIIWVDICLPLFKSFNKKIKLGIEGRKRTLSVLKDHLEINESVIWFHCASLGEYEQGLPVFQKIKNLYPTHKIVLSFFSPSGYENLKNNPLTDIVVYLPLDTRNNVKRFFSYVNPFLIVFVKSELWPNYLSHIKKLKNTAILISSKFKSGHYYFKFYGKYFYKGLFAFNHIFTQDNESKVLLQNFGFDNVTFSNDTRFDRVLNQLNIDNRLPFVEKFLNGQKCFVGGSTWPEDEALFLEFIKNSSQRLKFIIAPHQIDSRRIEILKNYFGSDAVLYSNYNLDAISEKKILIIDTIGLLNKIYSYADIAYVGGGMGNSGLHNILEPAVFGIPIIIGKNYYQFPEAVNLIKNGGVISVETSEQFSIIMDKLIETKRLIQEYGFNNKNFILKNKGASEIILKKLLQVVNN